MVMSFATIGPTGEVQFKAACEWRLVFEGKIIGYATKPEHFTRTIEVLGGGYVERIPEAPGGR